MTMIQHTAEEKAAFKRFAEIYLAARGAHRDVCGDEGLQPAAGSGAQQDLAALARRKPLAPGRASYLVLGVLQPLMYVAGESMGALAAMYATEEIMHGPLAVGRSVIEHSAHALWIIGLSSEKPEHRVARAFLEEMYSAKQVELLAKRQFGAQSAEHQDRLAGLRAIASDAKAMFETPEDWNPDQMRGLTLGGQTWPNHSDVPVLANRMTAHPLQKDQLLGIYGLLSNTVHPTVHQVRGLFEYEVRDGRPVFSINRDARFHEKLTQIVIGYFYNALTYVASYYGSEPDPVDRLTEVIDHLLPGLFGPGSQNKPFDPASRASI